MIEVVHFQNRWGKQMAGVFIGHSHFRTPEAYEYTQKYAAGLHRPRHPLPVTLEHVHAFAISYVIQLITELWDTEGP